MSAARKQSPSPRPDIAGELLWWAARQFGDRPAVIFEDQVRSFNQMESRSNRLANGMIRLGLKPGEHIAVLLDNSFESIEATFAAEKAALPCVALNARHTVAEHISTLSDAEAAALIMGERFMPLADKLRTALPGLREIICVGEPGHGMSAYEELIERAPETFPAIEIGPDHIVRLAYTSGTTGRPKGLVYTHRRLGARLANHFAAMEYGLSVDDAMIHVGPLTHAAGVHLLPCYLRGARNIIHRRFDAHFVLDEIARHRASHIMVVPTMLERLVEAIESGHRPDLSSLRRIHYGTAPTRPDLIRTAMRLFGPILRQQYGMTEAIQPLTVLYPWELEEMEAGGDPDLLRSCGKPTMNVSLTIRDEEGRELPPGEVGEIALAYRGIGEVAYWKPTAREDDTIRDGWFYTGDLGFQNQDGYLFIVGRRKDMIISGGFNVYAIEVENALTTHHAVAEAAVLGLPDREWGEVVTAVIVLHPGQRVTAGELADHCAGRITGYKKPRRIEFRDTLPRNATGKVIKAVLREQLLEQMENVLDADRSR